MNMEELKTESADMALRQSNRQIHGPRKELCHANQTHDISRRGQVWLQAELKKRKRAFQETRIRTQQLRVDELSLQELQESQSTVNRLSVEGQE